MRIGVPKEILNHEYRVGLTAAGVRELVDDGHDVFVQEGAGHYAGIDDEMYREAGAEILPDAAQVFERTEMIIKVKQPLAEEFDLLREGQILFTYLHMASDRDLTEQMMARKVTTLAYETVQKQDGSLPLLAPMSAIAGRLATQVASYHLLAPHGGSGVLMGGIPGARAANVLVIGGGVVGEHAAMMANGLNANVTVADIDLAKLGQLSRLHPGIATRFNTKLDLEQLVADADVVIGSVLVAGKRAPKLVTTDMVRSMRRGSVLVDVAIDQGGCFEDSHPTTHDDPIFEVGEAIFYCVANMPGSVPVTATKGLTNATLPYVRRIAKQGWQEACANDPVLAPALHTHDGALYHRGVAEAHDIEAADPSELLGR